MAAWRHIAVEPRMSLKDFRAADFGDRRCELIDGVPVLQAFPSAAHGAITANVVRALGDAIDRAAAPCRVETGTGVDIATLENDYSLGPDLLVRCGRTEGSPGEPVLLAEVLSPSNSAVETAKKLRAYQSLATVTDIVWLAQDAYFGEHHHRGPDGDWQRSVALAGPDAVLRIDRFDAAIPVATIYRDVLAAQFPARPAGPV